MATAKKKASSSGMKWTKSPEALVASFDAVLPRDSRIERRSMFGYPCAFVNGNMFTGLHQDSLIVRLDAADRAKLLALPGARVFEPMPGRPMQAYVVVPPAIVAERGALAGWIKRSLEHAASLPAKAKKATTAAKKATNAKRGAKARA
jgi:TfoX/Sxy family transcriptional regulator of competence genes